MSNKLNACLISVSLDNEVIMSISMLLCHLFCMVNSVFQSLLRVL